MGYSNYFHITVKSPVKGESERVMDRIEAIYGETFESKVNDKQTNTSYASAYDAHWYDFEQDCEKAAKEFPSAFIEVIREGEDRHDTQMVRFHGEQVESIFEQQKWPPFRTVFFPGENPFENIFKEGESFRDQMEAAAWRGIFAEFLDQYLFIKGPSTIKKRMKAIRKFIDLLRNDDEQSFLRRFETIMGRHVNENLKGFEDTKTVWVSAWDNAFEEITRRTASDEISVEEAFENLNICMHSNMPVKGDCYIYNGFFYASLPDMLMHVRFLDWLIAGDKELPTADFLDSYITF